MKHSISRTSICFRVSQTTQAATVALKWANVKLLFQLKPTYFNPRNNIISNPLNASKGFMCGRGSFLITFKRKKRYVVFNFKGLTFPIISMEKNFYLFWLLCLGWAETLEIKIFLRFRQSFFNRWIIYSTLLWGW